MRFWASFEVLRDFRAYVNRTYLKFKVNNSKVAKSLEPYSKCSRFGKHRSSTIPILFGGQSRTVPLIGEKSVYKRERRGQSCDSPYALTVPVYLKLSPNNRPLAGIDLFIAFCCLKQRLWNECSSDSRSTAYPVRIPVSRINKPKILYRFSLSP